MANRGRGRSGGRLSASGRQGEPPLTVRAEITGVARTSAEFRQARREFNTKMRDAIAAAGTKAVLPVIVARFPSRTFGASLYVKRDRTTVFIGSRMRGTLNRAVGWLDFGGKRTRDRVHRVGPKVILNELHGRRHIIDHEILVALMQTFKPLETEP